MNKYGKKILQLLAKRYKTVKNLDKCAGVLQKVNNNLSCIQAKLKEYKDAIFWDRKEILTSGNQFYDDLKKIFSDRDFFELRYLAMDALVYPIAASADEKLDLCLDSISDGEMSLTCVLFNCHYAFSGFFNHFNFVPRCLKSVLRIQNEENADRLPNCLNWQRFFNMPENVIIPNSRQVVGHDPIFKKGHKFIVFYSQIIEIDILQSVGYNFTNMVSYINKTFINMRNTTESYTFTYKAEFINRIKPKASKYNNYLDIFHNEDLKYTHGVLPKLNSKTSSKKMVLIILELVLLFIGSLLTLFGTMQVLGVILLIIETIRLFVTTFFHNKVAN